MPGQLFEKGQPRPPTAGRRRGTPNRSTQEIGHFCREILETPEFKQKWRDYFLTTPMEQIEPRLLVIAFAYGYGKPRERVELSGVDGDPLSPKIIFYLPNNQRQTPR